MNVNKKWHRAHPMPKNPTIGQRVQWHVQHVKNCQCRTDLPPKLKEEMKKRGIKA